MGPVIQVVGSMHRDQFASKKDGRIWVKYSQDAGLHNGGPFPERFDLVLRFCELDEDKSKPEAYEPGYYTLGASGLRVDRTGRLVVADRERLISLDDEDFARLQVA